MPIISAETEKQFAEYSSLLDLKQRLKQAYTTLTKDSEHISGITGSVKDFLEEIIDDIYYLQQEVDEAIQKIKPDKSLEERGYNPADRGFQGFSGCEGSCEGGNCGSGCGGCSS